MNHFQGNSFTMMTRYLRYENIYEDAGCFVNTLKLFGIFLFTLHSVIETHEFCCNFFSYQITLVEKQSSLMIEKELRMRDRSVCYVMLLASE